MTKEHKYRLWILPMALMLLSCGDGGKAQTAPEEEIHEFEIVGKKEKEPIDTDNEPVSVSTILSGKAPVDDGGSDDGLAGQYVDPLGGDESYLEGDGYDY
jgi:hypothetical protein